MLLNSIGTWLGKYTARSFGDAVLNLNKGLVKQIDSLDRFVSNTFTGLMDVLPSRGAIDLDDILVDFIDDAGKVATEKFDNVIRKVDAGDFAEDELKRLVVETKDALTTNQKGILGEAVSEVVYKNNPVKEGFEQVASKISSNNGIDGLYFKYAKDANGEYLLDATGSKIVEAIDVVEAKYGSSTLSTLADGTKQMSDDWVMYSAERMMDSADVAVQEAGELLFETLTSSPEKITKYLDNIVKDTGEVVTKVLDSAGNKIN